MAKAWKKINKDDPNGGTHQGAGPQTENTREVAVSRKRTVCQERCKKGGRDE